MRVTLWAIGILAVLAPPLMAQGASRVGVVGMITALDPVQINGLTLDIADDQPVISPLGPRSGKTLRLGHTMAFTLKDAGGEWTIERALHIYPLIGPVTDVENDVMTIMGSRVVAPVPGMFADIKPGYWVGVSGFWQGEQLLATRAGAIPPTGFAQLSGSYIVPEDDTSNARIGGTEIIGVLDDGVGTGDMWVLSGDAGEAGLKIGFKSPRLFAGEVDMVLAQGFASAPIASETYTLLGTGLIGYAKEKDMPDNSDVSILCAVDGTILRDLPQQEDLAILAVRLGCPLQAPDEAAPTPPSVPKGR